VRVLVLTPIYAPSYSGSALLFRRISEGLVKRGHSVTVATANALDYRAFWVKELPVNDLPPEENLNGVAVVRLPVRRRHSSRNYWRLVHYSWKYRLPGNDWLRTWYDGPILCGVNAVASRGEYDIVCAGHTPSMMVVYGRRIATKLRVPFVVIPGLHTGKAFDVDRLNMARLLQSADCVCANTVHEASYLRTVLRMNERRICITGCGVSPDEFARADGVAFRERHGVPNDAGVVLYVGAEVEHKGLLVLVEAFRTVLAQIPESFLVIAGVRSGCSEALDRVLAADPHLSGRVVRLNSFSDAEKADIFDACDVFALPSWSESFGIVYLEAWVRAKPVIGCRGGAVETVIEDGKDGILVDPGNAEQLGDGIAMLLKDPLTRAQMGELGRAKVLSSHTWAHVTDRAEQAFIGCTRTGRRL